MSAEVTNPLPDQNDLKTFVPRKGMAPLRGRDRDHLRETINAPATPQNGLPFADQIAHLNAGRTVQCAKNRIHFS